MTNHAIKTLEAERTRLDRSLRQAVEIKDAPERFRKLAGLGIAISVLRAERERRRGCGS